MDNSILVFPTVESKMSEHFKAALILLEMSGQCVRRLVRNNEVFALQIYGNMFQDLEKCEKILGEGYHCSLNPNSLSITII